QFNREQRWWAIIGMLVCVVVGYRLVHGVHAVQQQALAASRMTTEERAQAQAKSLEQIKDPKQREAMLQFYQQLNELADKQKKSQ
ncbi:MAG TPA: hypothetical protein VFM34_06040, partial [Moraxellaceae bacterium]|nr:hypothetical protein [Moraxellaceae bacterium]